MGWDYLTNTRPTSAKKYLDTQFAKGLVASSMRGNEYYAAMRMGDTNMVYGLVVIVDRKHGEFGYKAMDENMGPYYYNCPESVLKHLTHTGNANALKWRAECVRRADLKKMAVTLKTGDVITFEEPLSFGSYGLESTFTVAKMGKVIRFYMEKNGMLCRISNWKTRAFTIQHKATV